MSTLAERLRRRRLCAGFTVVELLVTLFILGTVTTSLVVMWQRTRTRAVATSAARMTKLFIHQARMRSIFEGVNHFVVLDPEGRHLEIYADTGATAGSFDDDDERLASTELSESVGLVLPTDPVSIASPLDASSVTEAWSLPEPDDAARWGTALRGVMTTPRGLITSAEATPTPITAGLIVFSTRDNVTSAVGIRGLEGFVGSYELNAGAWKAL